MPVVRALSGKDKKEKKTRVKRTRHKKGSSEKIQYNLRTRYRKGLERRNKMQVGCSLTLVS